MTRGTRSLVVLVAVTVVLAAGCGDGTEPVRSEGPTTTSDPVAPSEASSPFTVGPVPERYQVVAVGEGRLEGSWGEDCCGTDEPYTVLSPDGRPDHPELVVVSTTGFDGYQFGLEQAAPGDVDEGTAREIEVDGDEGIYVPPSADWPWGYLIAARGEDLAVSVRAPDASQEELEEILDAVVLAEDRTQAPQVPEPPDGLQLVGSADVAAVLARFPGVDPDDAAAPGPVSAHAVAWVDPTPTTTATEAGGGDRHDALSVQTLPGRAGDAAALAVGHGSVEDVSAVEERSVDGRPAYVADWTQYGVPQRSVWLDSAWGDLVVVTAAGEGSLPSADELVADAASVQPADTATWEAAVSATAAPTA